MHFQCQGAGVKPGQLEVCPEGFEADLLTLGDLQEHPDWEVRRVAADYQRRMSRGTMDKTTIFFDWNGIIRQGVPGKDVEMITATTSPRARPSKPAADLPSWAPVKP